MTLYITTACFIQDFSRRIVYPPLVLLFSPFIISKTCLFTWTFKGGFIRCKKSLFFFATVFYLFDPHNWGVRGWFFLTVAKSSFCCEFFVALCFCRLKPQILVEKENLFTLMLLIKNYRKSVALFKRMPLSFDDMGNTSNLSKSLVVGHNSTSRNWINSFLIHHSSKATPVFSTEGNVGRTGKRLDFAILLIDPLVLLTAFISLIMVRKTNR